MAPHDSSPDDPAASAAGDNQAQRALDAVFSASYE